MAIKISTFHYRCIKFWGGDILSRNLGKSYSADQNISWTHHWIFFGSDTINANIVCHIHLMHTECLAKVTIDNLKCARHKIVVPKIINSDGINRDWSFIKNVLRTLSFEIGYKHVWSAFKENLKRWATCNECREFCQFHGVNHCGSFQNIRKTPHKDNNSISLTFSFLNQIILIILIINKDSPYGQQLHPAPNIDDDESCDSSFKQHNMSLGYN